MTSAETFDLDLIEWDSDAATITMGDQDGSGASFDPEPLNFRETGDSYWYLPDCYRNPRSFG